MSLQDLDEDTTDDILYFARSADLPSLQSILSTTSKSLALPPYELLSTAADPHTGNTAMHMAAANGHTDILKFILDLSPALSDLTGLSEPADASTPPTAIADRTNQSGNTALHWAALNGHLEAVKLLVGAGASLEVKNKAGHSVVFEAAKAEKEDVVAWLLGAAKDKGSGEDDVKEELVEETSNEDTAGEELRSEIITSDEANFGGNPQEIHEGMADMDLDEGKST